MENLISSSEAEVNLTAAQSLLNEAQAAGFTYGCLEISLVALGAKLTLKDVNRSDRQPTLLAEAIERTGLEINWIVSTDSPVTAEDVNAILTGKMPFTENYPADKLAGHLLMEHGAIGHVIAIPHIEGRSDHYEVMDSAVGGRIRLAAENLAYLINAFQSEGKSFEIVEIKQSFR